MSTGALRVAVLSRYGLVRAGLSALLTPAHARVTVVDTDGSGAHLDGVDVVVCDMAGLADEATRTDLQRVLAGSVAVVGLIRDGREDLEHGAHALGVHTTVPEQVSAADLLDAIERAAGRGRRGPPGALTDRERLVLTLIGAGLSNHEIAAELLLSINSVKTYIRTAYHKIGVHTRPQAVLWAIRHGLLPKTD